MSTQTHFDCETIQGDYLEILKCSDGDVTLEIRDSLNNTEETALFTLARRDIPKLISSLQAMYEQGNN